MTPAYTRIQWLHEQIRALRYPNAQRLCERFSISRRQGQRDIHFLREELGAPLVYTPERRGFCYSTDFSLPIYYKNANEGDYAEFLDAQSLLIEQQVAAENGHPRYVQLQIPFTAMLHIPDKLTRMALDRFVVEEKGNDRFLCEFSQVDLFLSAILLADGEVHILSPNWLRERLLDIARRAIERHAEESV
ncbi:MAG: hypothetical protein IJF49_04865 [Clostridia bacterium]|nr:hypothetical protein [Clostridia bacterium]